MEENKLNEIIQSILDKLTDEQKEKASSCGTLKELLALIDGWGVELPEAVLNDIAGGIYSRPDVLQKGQIVP